MNRTEPTTVEQAYRVLNVPKDSSAMVIKQAYRRLLKRWHPDLQKAGSAAHAESTEMARRINEAYALIEHAPLRYGRLAHARNVSPQAASPQSGQAENAAWREFILRQALRAEAKTPPRMDRVEFWVRFVCGAIFGFAVAFVLSLDLWSYPSSHRAYSDAVTVPIFLLIVAAFGYGSARMGDRFWYALFGLKEPRL